MSGVKKCIKCESKNVAIDDSDWKHGIQVLCKECGNVEVIHHKEFREELDGEGKEEVHEI